MAGKVEQTGGYNFPVKGKRKHKFHLVKPGPELYILELCKLQFKGIKKLLKCSGCSRILIFLTRNIFFNFYHFTVDDTDYALLGQKCSQTFCYRICIQMHIFGMSLQ